MKRIWIIFLFAGFFIFLLVYILFTYYNWNAVKTNFYNYSFSDIINLLFTGYIGIIVMVIFSTMTSNSMKRREIISENLTALQANSEYVLTILSNNLNSSINDNSKGHLLRSLRIASNEFTNIQEFLITEIKDKEIKLLLKITEANLINLKQATTDKPFHGKYKINESDIQYATDSHNELKQNTQKIKLYLYK